MPLYSEWRPLENYVQPGLEDGKFVNAAFIKIASGPPRLEMVGGNQAAAAIFSTAAPTVVYPLGLVQNTGLTSNTNFAQVFEIGSNRSLFIAGRTMHGLTLGTVFYHGPSLLRRLYAYYQDTEGETTVPWLFPNIGAANNTLHDVKVPPGFQNLFWNLGSDLFWQPIGLLFYVEDVNEDTIGAVYAEGSVVPNWSVGTDAQGAIVQEQVSINFERLVPVAVSALTITTQ